MSQETNFNYRLLDMLLKTLQMTLKERLNVVIFVNVTYKKCFKNFLMTL